MRELGAGPEDLESACICPPHSLRGTHPRTFRVPRCCFYRGRVLELSGIDVEEITNALADQTDYDHRWLIDPRTGEVVFWTSDTGIDGQNQVDPDELDLVPIDPVPSYVWFQDMADFAGGISDSRASEDLARALRERKPFRRFRDRIYDRHPELISSWQGLREARGRRRAVEWLLDNNLIDERAAEAFMAENPDPDLP